MPFRYAAHLRRQAGAGESIIQRTYLPIEHVRVGVCQTVALVCVARAGDDANRIFHRVGIQIAHDEEVAVAAAGGVRGQPVDQRRGGVGARDVAVALPVAQIRVAHVGTGRTFGFEVVYHDGKRLAAAVLAEGLSQSRPVFRVQEEGII